jgi:hypothetical protein
MKGSSHVLIQDTILAFAGEIEKTHEKTGMTRINNS